MPGWEFFVKKQPDFYGFWGFWVGEMRRFDHLVCESFKRVQNKMKTEGVRTIAQF
jgi:hypothetical protein